MAKASIPAASPLSPGIMREFPTRVPTINFLHAATIVLIASALAFSAPVMPGEIP